MNLNHRVISVTFIQETNERPSRFKLTEQRAFYKDKITLNWSSDTDLSSTLLQAVHYLKSIGINVVGYGNYGKQYFIFSDSWATEKGFKNILNKLELNKHLKIYKMNRFPNIEDGLIENIIGDINDYGFEIKFIIYSNHAPYVGERYNYNGNVYEVESETDVTTDDEFEQGLSYSQIKMLKK